MEEPRWFYSKAGSGLQAGPVPEREIRELLASGQLQPEDLVWREGWAGWARVDQVSELAPGAPPSLPSGTVPHGLLGWMTFVGVACIILGVGSCLTCFGTISGILMIIGGSALLSARAALARVPSVDGALQPFLHHLKVALQITAWIIILSLLTAILFIGFHLGLMAGILKSLMGGAPPS